jgi:transposase
MGYTIEQKIGNNIYLYEVTAYWDKDKRQARQKRTYLGKKDPRTNKPITTRKSNKPQAVRDYGHVYAMQKIAEQVGLNAILEQSFPHHGEKLLCLAIYRLLENKPFYLQKLWAENTCINQELAMSSQNISKLLQKIGLDSNVRFDFFARWIKRHNKSECLFFDITSLSSYSKLIDFVEWGYNRDQEKLPQINLGLLQSHPKRLPLFYQLYPGSIADVSTLKNIIKQASGLALKINTMVMDKGFYSMGNLLELERNGAKFIIPLPTTTKAAKEFLNKHQVKLTSPLNAFHQKNGTIFHIQDHIEVSGHLFTAHLYLDEQKRLDEINHLVKQLDNLEFLVANGSFSDKNDLTEFMERTMKGSSNFYNIKINKNAPELTRREDTLVTRMNQSGRMILITNNKTLAREEALALYRQKDIVEKMFDILKNEIDDARLHVQSREAMEGNLFILFIALIIYAELTRRMQSNNLFKKYTVAEVLGELKKIRIVTMIHGASYVTEVSKKQRELLSALNLSIPVASSY